MNRLCLLGTILLMVTVGPVMAGSLGFTGISPFMDWEPDCNEPYPPSFYIHDIDSYNSAVDEFNRYVTEVDGYLRCLESEANSDLNAVSSAISNGLDEKQSAAINEAEQMQRDLEREAMFLQ